MTASALRQWTAPIHRGIPQSRGIAAAFHHRVRKLKGRIRRISIVAVARSKLLIALWRYLERGLVPEGPILNV
jgi:hypothetical protein